MPELPEVEAVRRALSPQLVERSIVRVTLRRTDVVAWPPDPDRFAALLTGKRLEPLERRGKYLGFPLGDGTRLWLHLRMTGKLSLVPPGFALPDHTHVILSLDDGRDLRFYDTRRFGRLWALQDGEEDHVTGISELGAEPAELTGPALAALLSGRRRPIKSALLDQHLVAGLGNIYADEILYRAGISPLRPSGELTEEEASRLAAVMGPTLEEAVQRGVNCSRQLFGETLPSRQPKGWMVYGRRGQTCRRCGSVLLGTRSGGRSTVYCPECQI